MPILPCANNPPPGVSKGQGVGVTLDNSACVCVCACVRAMCVTTSTYQDNVIDAHVYV